MTEDTPIQFPQDDRQLLQQVVVLMQDLNHRFGIAVAKVNSAGVRARKDFIFETVHGKSNRRARADGVNPIGIAHL